jgi:ethanolamine kinase
MCEEPVHLPHLSIDPSSPASVRALVRAACAWAGAAGGGNDAALLVETVSGGITNVLWRVALAADISGGGDDGDGECLVRVFGARSEQLIDREADGRAVAFLARRGIAPPLLATFANGRVEGFVRGARALEPAELGAPRIALLVARAVAAMHRAGADFPFAPAGRDAEGRALPALWPTLERWAALALADGGAGAAAQPGPEPEAEAAERRALRERIPRELEWLRRALLRRPRAEAGAGAFGCGDDGSFAEGAEEGTDAAAEAAAADAAEEVVFAHNDLLSGNLLLVEGGARADGDAGTDAGAPVGVSASAGDGDNTARLHVIDFEYAAFNHRGFDLANHFCEHCGFEFERARFPPRAAQRAFLAEYCAAAALGAAGPAGGAVGAVGGAFLDALQRRVERFCLASDLFWGLWARAQSRISLIDFDFAGYSARRLAAYDERKAQLFPRAPRLAPPLE